MSNLTKRLKRKFWIVMFWFEKKEGDYLVYIPSRYHHAEGSVQFSRTYEGALTYGRAVVRLDSAKTAGIPGGDRMPVFIPYIHEGARPDVTRHSTLRLLVERISLAGED